MPRLSSNLSCYNHPVSRFMTSHHGRAWTIGPYIIYMSDPVSCLTNVWNEVLMAPCDIFRIVFSSCTVLYRLRAETKHWGLTPPWGVQPDLISTSVVEVCFTFLDGLPNYNWASSLGSIKLRMLVLQGSPVRSRRLGWMALTVQLCVAAQASQASALRMGV